MFQWRVWEQQSFPEPDPHTADVQPVAVQERHRNAIVEVHINPVIGTVRLARLGPQYVQALLRGMMAEGLSPSTVHQARRVIHTALEHARRWHLVRDNAAEFVSAPPANAREGLALHADEVRTLLDRVHSDRLEALYVVASTTGLRQGEAIGLT